MSFSRIQPEAYDRALKACRGKYQRNLLDGWEALSGSTLKGKAAKYSMRYKASAANLLERLRAAGLVVSEERGPKGKRILVVSLPAS